ncbi:MAG: NTP transferase domain-containing protein [Muribaculaceae bacterium]|nr:NTP transferase domain-containing protein [Muribaculaceae bacterium]
MKTMIMCAGLGTRLKPWTDEHPKALVPVGGVPMLRRVIERLADQGFDEVTINVHHFADQIIEFIQKEKLPVKNINVSHESKALLDTGGGILNAESFLAKDSRPFLVHNVDILSNADLKKLYDAFEKSDAHIILLVSDRKSDRRLVFDKCLNLKGWVNLKTGHIRPDNLIINEEDKILAFSGIYIMSPEVFSIMKNGGFSGAFPIMDFFLSGISDLKIKGVSQDGLEIIDIGKPDTLHRANLKIQ